MRGVSHRRNTANGGRVVWARPNALGRQSSTIVSLYFNADIASAPRLLAPPFILEDCHLDEITDKLPSAVNSTVVELVGVFGYYALVAMTLNVFAVRRDTDTPLPFAEL